MNKQNDPVMYFVVNQDLGMKAGKVAAQVGHAADVPGLRDAELH